MKPNENPPAVAMPHFDGAEFVKVIVDIDSNARAVALTSKKIDVVFWVTVPGEFWYAEGANSASKDIDKIADLEITNPYFRDEIVHIGNKG